jgi:beta-glucosidase-like glycosyl hydrolase
LRPTGIRWTFAPCVAVPHDIRWGRAYQVRQAGGRTLYLDQGDTQIDEETLRQIHLPPYVAAVKAGVGSIMVSYSMWNGVRVSGRAAARGAYVLVFTYVTGITNARTDRSWSHARDGARCARLSSRIKASGVSNPCAI